MNFRSINNLKQGNKMKQLFLFVFFGFIALSVTVDAQSASASWALTTNGIPVTIGNVTASTIDTSITSANIVGFASRSFADTNFTGLVLGVSGFKSWPGDTSTTVVNSTFDGIITATGRVAIRYVQFTFSPAVGNSLTVDSLSMRLTESGPSTNINAALGYSTDGINFIPFNSNAQSGNVLTSNTPITFTSAPAISVSSGGTFTVRMIMWRKANTQATNCSVYINNVAFYGTTISTSEICSTIPVATSWNMVALPILPTNPGASAIFPAATSQVFSFENGYVAQTVLATGKSYWVRYPSAENIQVCGASASGGVALATGWNMIGVYNATVPVSSLTTTPAGILSSNFYGFNGGYAQPTNLEPGKGYWIRASQAGTMNLPVSLLVKSGYEVVQQIQKDWSKILITDKTGNASTLCVAKSDINTSLFELPPVPPAGVFDARFASQSMVENITTAAKVINISGATYPVEVRAEGIDLQVRDKATGKLLNSIVKSGSSIVIANENIISIEVSSIAKPAGYELMQNYPNPFNPSTLISFTIPENTKVNLTIYNQIGEQIGELINGQMESGYHQVTWNALNISSGVYFYEIKTDKFRSVKKLIIMK